MDEKRKQEIQEALEKIDALQSEARILSAPCPLSANNRGQGHTLDDFRKAGDAQEEVWRLQEELRNGNE